MWASGHDISFHRLCPACAIPAFCAAFVTSAWACAIAAMKAINEFDRLFYWIGCYPVEGHPVDHRLDADLLSDEFAYNVGHVLIIAS